MRCIHFWIVCIAVLCAGVALADGGIFPQFAGTASSADQRAVIVHDGSGETIILQTVRTGDSAGFAWVLPTPARLQRQDVEEVSPRVFDELYSLTEPRAYTYTGGRTLGCFGGSSSGPTGYAGVKLWDQFQVSDYQVSVLSADDSANLDRWLNDNGYRTPDGMNDVLDHYVSKNWYFTALKVDAPARDGESTPPPGSGDPGDQLGEDGRDFDALQFSFRSSQIVFPMRISQLSTDREVSVLLYVFAPHRVRGANWDTAQIDVGGDWDGSNFAGYYEGKFRDALASIGVPGLVVEYAAEVDEYWLRSHQGILPVDPAREYFLTRLRTYLQAPDMTDDIVLTEAVSDDEFSVRLASTDSPPSPVRLAMVVVLVVGAIVCTRYRTLGTYRNIVLIALALAVLIL